MEDNPVCCGTEMNQETWNFWVCLKCGGEATYSFENEQFDMDCPNAS